MKRIVDPEQMRRFSRRNRSEDRSIGFVPTMGYLHQGHLSLAESSVSECDRTVLSIYVNPTQFGPDEDLDKYPRNMERDLDLAKSIGVDIVFTPETDKMYPAGYRTYVDTEAKFAKGLCARKRPGHFRGVMTVVTKLLNIVEPDMVYFGQKDLQQCIVIGSVIEDLNLPIELKMLPIVREPDGLAMSSRNKYLNNDERSKAPYLYRSLLSASRLIERDQEKDAGKIKEFIRKKLLDNGVDKIDYIEIVHPEDLEPMEEVCGECAILIAAFIGPARLIDNIIVSRQGPE